MITRWIVQRSIWAEQWEDWECWLSDERAIASARSWHQHRLDGTGPNASYRVVKRVEQVMWPPHFPVPAGELNSCAP